MQCSGIIQLLVLIIQNAKINTYGYLGACYIEKYEEKKTGIPEVPEFLRQKSKTDLCRGTQEGTKQLFCGGDFILPGCVCSYHHVANKSNHKYTACRDNSKQDSIEHMTCKHCHDYSINGAGPCLNGGKVICESDEDLATDLECSCTEKYSGIFCEKENVTLYRICQLDQQESNLPDCQERPEEVCRMVFGSWIVKCLLNSTEDKLYQPCSSLNDLELKSSKLPERQQKTAVNSSNFFQKTFMTLACFTLLQITLSS